LGGLGGGNMGGGLGGLGGGLGQTKGTIGVKYNPQRFLKEEKEKHFIATMTSQPECRSKVFIPNISFIQPPFFHSV